MASYGSYPAYKIKRKLNIPLLISLGDQIIPSKLSVKYWYFRLIASASDQISTNVSTEIDITRKSSLKWLTSFNKTGDVFPNAFRFAYNVIFDELPEEVQSKIKDNQLYNNINQFVGYVDY